ncbi:endonuclease domain-containing protein [Microbacterium sp. H83]|uniref:endonuclease domain-containing protein n=1 Tax=Microbacterium sp. H83 TaxID=1827324 RepID=UPI0007F36973|nr:hypothetical protein [Microbacterium sp. H83]OAN36708.1 hypothetical protein A4X16_04465 [Microbacterium sp. H83]
MCVGPGIEVWTWRELREHASRRAIEGRLRRGELRRVRRGVYAASSACAGAVEAAAHGGSLGCETAARHLGIWVLDDTLTHVWLRRDRHHRTAPSPDCDCIRHWDAGPSTSTFALPSVARILLQIYRCRGAEAFFVALESARRRGLLPRRALRWLSGALDRAGRDLVAFSRSDADSGLESLTRLRLRRFGWDVRTQTQVVGTGRVDLLIDGWLIIETDGRENHESAEHRHRDLVRDATSASWGHVTLRFDYAMLLHDWELVERAIIGLMALRP